MIPPYFAASKTRSMPNNIQGIGVNEAPNLYPKAYAAPDQSGVQGFKPPSGAQSTSSMPFGGVDMNPKQAGQQLMPPQQQGGLPQGIPQQAQQGQTPPEGNMLQMTPQGQAMGAMSGGQQPQMADGGSVKGYTHEVYDPKTNEVIGKYKSIEEANKVQAMDGGKRYAVREIKSLQSKSKGVKIKNESKQPKQKVTVHQDIDVMKLELNKKGK